MYSMDAITATMEQNLETLYMMANNCTPGSPAYLAMLNRIDRLNQAIAEHVNTGQLTTYHMKKLAA